MVITPVSCLRLTLKIISICWFITETLEEDKKKKKKEATNPKKSTEGVKEQKMIKFPQFYFWLYISREKFPS